MSQLWSYIIKLLKQHRLVKCESKNFLHFTTILPLILTVQTPLQITWSSILYACCSYFPPLSTVVSSAEKTRIQRPWIIDSVLNGLQQVKWKPNHQFHIQMLKNISLAFIKIGPLTLRLLMSYIYIYGAPILDVSRSYTTTHHSR